MFRTNYERTEWCRTIDDGFMRAMNKFLPEVIDENEKKKIHEDCCRDGYRSCHGGMY
jgi:hypothetical protein